jgi:hypothetical protein
MPDKALLKEHFEKLYGRPLSDAELFECEQNLFGVFKILFNVHKRNLSKDAEVNAEIKQEGSI